MNENEILFVRCLARRGEQQRREKVMGRSTNERQATGRSTSTRGCDGKNHDGERDDGERRYRGERSARERKGNRTNNPFLLERFITKVYTRLNKIKLIRRLFNSRGHQMAGFVLLVLSNPLYTTCQTRHV